MQGHATAFGQLTSMDRGEMFPSQFGDWLYRVKGLSCASGWAYAIEEHCKETGERALNVFNDYVRMFVDEWDPDGKK